MAAVLDGRIILVMLVFVVIEFVVLTLIWKTRGIGIAPFPLFVNLAAGSCLMLALRAVLVGSSVKTVTAWLVLSLVAHLSDLIVRWRGSGRT